MKRSVALLALVPVLCLSSCGGAKTYLEDVLGRSGAGDFKVPAVLEDGGEALLSMGFARRIEDGNEIYLSSNGNTELTYAAEDGAFVRYRSCDPYWTLAGLRPLLGYKVHLFDDTIDWEDHDLLERYVFKHPDIFEEDGWTRQNIPSSEQIEYSIYGMFSGWPEWRTPFTFEYTFAHEDGLVGTYSLYSVYEIVHQFEIATEEAGLLMSWPFE